MHTTTDSKKKSLQLILLQEVLNTGIIITFASFDPTGLVESMSTKPENVKVGKITYHMFEYDWYFDVGVVICIALAMSIFTSNIFEFFNYIRRSLKRMEDRMWLPNLKRYPDEEDDDDPNTLKNTQDDLEKLYEGEEFQGEKNISRMTSTFFIIIMYSSGMPILYMIGIAFFTVTYINEKWLLFKFYKRTQNNLNQDIPMYAANILKYVLFTKIIIGILMFTDPNIFKTVTKPDPSYTPLKIDIK